MPKTNGIVIADTFQWLQDNTFQLLSISHKEQLARAANNLVLTIKYSHRFNTPDKKQNKAWDYLIFLFKNKVDIICHNKLAPLAQEI